MAINGTPNQAQELPESLIEEAAMWLARMQEPDAGADRCAGFARWLAADPLHARAYAETERLWSALEAPVARVLAEETVVALPPRPVVKRRASSGWRWGAVAACLLLMLGAGVSWQEGVFDNLRSDYVTATGAHRSVTLADGSEVILNTDSALAVAFTPERRAVHLFRGEAWFSVTHNAARPFVVETAEGDVQVTGTQFNVRISDGQAIVSLVEGKVALTSADPGSSGLNLVAGQQAVLTGSSIDAPTAFDASAVTAWQHGQMVFYQTPLEQVVAQLNRYREGRIVVASDGLRDLKVTGVFDADDPNAALSVIQNTLHVRVLRLTNYLVLLR